MLHVGFNTPFRIVLLILIKRFCKYGFPAELVPHMIKLIMNYVLFEDQCKKTCLEPTLRDIQSKIDSFIEDQELKSSVWNTLTHDIIKIQSPYAFDTFMSSLDHLLDDGPERDSEDMAVLEKSSVLGLFVRKCRISYLQLSPLCLSDIREAFLEYIQVLNDDLEFFNDNDDRQVCSAGWISDYNIKEFLKYQAEQIEITGTTNISTTDLHGYLEKIEKQLPTLANIRQVRYLNYTRTKEYIMSLSHLHLWSDTSLNKDVNIQYALLNTGILEYKFGHSFNALSALNDALAAARSNKDEFCLQEVQYWIEVCRKNHPFNECKTYTDPYLKNMKILTRTRNLLCEGAPCRYVFENLYKSLIDIITNDVKYIDRVQFLVTSLAWQRYGNDILSNFYLTLAKQFGNESLEEIENTVITEANKLQSLGQSEEAINVLTHFVNRYKDESDFLMGWRQAKARILRQSNRKRHFNMIDNQADVLQFAIPPDSEEYFNAIHDHAYNLMLAKEFEKSLQVLDNVYEFIQKTDQISHTSPNLILQALVHMNMDLVQTAIPILVQAMKAAKECHDSKNYYNATIKLSEAYVRLNDTESAEKAIYMLENIFPKVLLMKSKLLESDLYLTYALALHASSDSNKLVYEYVIKAEQGYKQLSLKRELLKTLHFKVILADKLRLVNDKNKTLEEIKSL